MSMMQKKKILAVAMAGLLVSSPVAFAGFQVVYEGAAPKPLTPVQVVTETHENARLRAELDRLSAELAQVKADLEFARTDAAQSRQALLTANAKLDLIQSKIEKIVVSFAFGNTEFVPQPEVAEKIVTYAKLAGTVNVRGYTDSVGTPAANQRVALQRAIAAKQYLVSRGVEEVKVKVFGRTGDRATAPSAGRATRRGGSAGGVRRARRRSPRC